MTEKPRRVNGQSERTTSEFELAYSDNAGAKPEGNLSLENGEWEQMVLTDRTVRAK